MTDIIEALYDGKVFRPTGPVALAPNTRVRMTIKSLPSAEREGTSFLRTARALELEGPPDWSDNIGEQIPRKPLKMGLFRGRIHMADDFNDPLPDGLWLDGNP